MLAALKRELLDRGAATSEGFDAGGEEVERIKALADELAARNPTPAPARAEALLRGRWRMVYSSFGLQRATTLARLSFNALPKTPVAVGEIHQEVDPATGLYDNVVEVGLEGGARGVSVVLGQYRAEGEHRLGVVFSETFVTGGPGFEPMRVPIPQDKLPPLHSDVVFLDDELRLNRGSFGSLYVLEREAERPRWSRELWA